MRKLALLLLLFPSLAYAQSVRYQSQVTGRLGPIAGASVAVCTQPANTSTTPCSPLATLATSTSTTSGGTNPTTTDQNGNFFFYAASGNYTVQIYSPQITSPFVQPDTLLACGASGNCTITGTVDAGKDNSIFWAGSTLYPTCQSAVTAAGTTNKSIIAIRSDYAAAACPATIPENITVVSYDAVNRCDVLNSTPPCSAVSYNFDDTVVYSQEKHQLNTSHQDANGVTLNLYGVTTLMNATANGTSGIDGISGEANTKGTLSGTFGALQAHEADATLRSTGGTISNVRAGIFYVNSDVGSTTAVTNVFGVDALGCNTISGAVPTNCYGAFFHRQDLAGVGKASGRNYSFASEGPGLFQYISSTGFAGIDMEASNHGTHHVLFTNSSNQLILGAVDATGGLLLEDSSGGVQQTILSTGTAFAKILPLPNNTVALTADWTCGTAGTVASCVAATIIGSGGGVPLTFTLPLIAQSYTLECDGVVGQATAATANQWNLLTATNGATNVTASYSMATAATASAYGAVTDQASTTTTFQIAPSWTLGGTATKMPFHIWAKVEGASVSGTVVSLQLVAPTVGDLVTIYRGTACRVF